MPNTKVILGFLNPLSNTTKSITLKFIKVLNANSEGFGNFLKNVTNSITTVIRAITASKL